MFCKTFFLLFELCVKQYYYIIIAISVASSSLNNPVHKLVQEDGHGKLPVLEIYILIIDSFIFKFYFKISKERQKYVFGVFRFNMVVYYSSNQITKKEPKSEDR
jgi:hypothetical protein